MGILTQAIDAETRAATPAPWDDYWYMPFGAAAGSVSGVQITDDRAMRVSTWITCVRILAESIASLPLHLYRKLPTGGKERATSHPLYPLMHDAPNSEQTAFGWRELTAAHVVSTGNAFSEISRNRAGRPVALWPWNPRRVEVRRGPTNEVEYELTLTTGDRRVIPRENVLHIPGLAWSGLRGMDPIELHKETLGLTAAAEEFAGSYYKNGTQPGVVVELPQGVGLSPEQHQKRQADLRAKYSGLGKAHRLMLLDDGAQLKNISISPDQSQFLETRKFQKAEIASLFRIPLHMVQEMEKSTSWGSGIEQLNIGFVVHTLRPWLVRFEQIFTSRLLSEADRASGLFFEFLIEGMLRGDLGARQEFYAAMRDRGVMNADDIRERENLNPMPDGLGQRYWIAANMQPLDDPVVTNSARQGGAPDPGGSDPGGARAVEPEPAECPCGACRVAGDDQLAAAGPTEPAERRAEIRAADARRRTQARFRKLLARDMARVIRRERNDIMRQARKVLKNRDRSDLISWLEDYYRDHPGTVRDEVASVYESFADAVGADVARELDEVWEDLTDEQREWVAGWVERFAEGHSVRSLEQLRQLLDSVTEDEALAALEMRMDEWENGVESDLGRAEKIAAGESVGFGQRFARYAMVAGFGVAALYWRNTGGETCPYCTALNGRRVSGDEPFLDADADFQPDGADAPLRPSRPVMSPPAHGGCDCTLTTG